MSNRALLLIYINVVGVTAVAVAAAAIGALLDIGWLPMLSGPIGGSLTLASLSLERSA